MDADSNKIGAACVAAILIVGILYLYGHLRPRIVTVPAVETRTCEPCAPSVVRFRDGSLFETCSRYYSTDHGEHWQPVIPPAKDGGQP